MINPWNGFRPNNAVDNARLHNLNRQVPSPGQSVTPWNGFSPTNAVDRERLRQHVRNFKHGR